MFSLLLFKRIKLQNKNTTTLKTLGVETAKATSCSKAQSTNQANNLIKLKAVSVIQLYGL